MTTDIAYLEDLREDLLLVAQREMILREAPALARRRARARRRPSRRSLIVIGVAATLAAAAAIGAFVTRAAAPTIEAVPRTAPDLQARLAPPSGQHLADAGPIFGPIAPGGGGGGGSAPAPATAPPPAGTDGTGSIGTVAPLIVKTAELSIVVPRGRFTDAFAKASAVASPLGGYVESSSTSGTRSKSGELTIRVPADRFDAALAALRPLGRIESQAIEGQDVTAQYVDLTARLHTWQAQEQALLRLMAKATSVSDTLRVQAQLQHVQLTIEQLKGQIRVMRNRAANATITVALREPGPAAPAVQTVQNPSIGTAFRRALAGVLNVVVAIVVGLGYLVPIALLVGVAWLAVRSVRRRRFAATA